MISTPAGTPIQIQKQSFHGEVLFQYPGWLCDEQDPIRILARWQLPDLPKPYTTFAHGDLLLEFFYRQRPYNIFALFDAKTIPCELDFAPVSVAQPSPIAIKTLCQRVGSHCALKGYYINFTRPMHYDPEQRLLAWRDAILDMWVPAQGPPQMLDEAEYRALNLSATDAVLARSIENARQNLLHQARTHTLHHLLTP